MGSSEDMHRQRDELPKQQQEHQQEEQPHGHHGQQRRRLPQRNRRHGLHRSSSLPLILLAFVCWTSTGVTNASEVTTCPNGGSQSATTTTDTSTSTDTTPDQCTTAPMNSTTFTTYSPRHLDHGVLDWIASQPGAYYNRKQIMDERDGLVGIYAIESIAKGELLCRIPWEWTLQGEEDEYEQLSCPLVASLIQHMALGETSKYGPYIQYVKNQPDHQLPSVWSKSGQELMLKILGQTREENWDRGDDDDENENLESPSARPPRSLAHHFPPQGMLSWIEGDFRNICKMDQRGDKAALLALMRADDSMMIPGYDFVSTVPQTMYRGFEWWNLITMPSSSSALPLADEPMSYLIHHLPLFSSFLIHLPVVTNETTNLSTIIEMVHGTMPIPKSYIIRHMKRERYEIFKPANRYTSVTIYVPIVEDVLRGTVQQVSVVLHGERMSRPVRQSYDPMSSTKLTNVSSTGTASSTILWSSPPKKEMFRDYGFTEAFPQRWHYVDFNLIEFDLDIGKNDTTYVVEWLRRPKTRDAIETNHAWLRNQVRRLERVWYLDYGHGNRKGSGSHHSESIITDKPDDISQFEWDMTWSFQRANLVALNAAIQTLSSTDSKVEVTILPRDDIDILHLYHPLDDDSETWKRIDTESMECTLNEFDFDDYTNIDRYNGFLQRIDISESETDTCLDRNGRLHVCSSFRPTYYEYFVHPVASLLNIVRRVLIMANGASFLLHEIMKYSPTLEYVMVMEPDPAMTRLSQQHFHVSPHWDDPRVQWWFGDVGAALTLLSEDQWKSFDFVLIDLPKTSFVTIFRNDITPLDLIHEKGIVVSHTNQWQEFSNIFPYTARMVYKPTEYCHHTLTVASPTIDFMRAPAKNHRLKDTFAYDSNVMMETKRRRELIHDWQSGFVNNKDSSRLHHQTPRVSEHISEPLGVLEVLELGKVNTKGDLEAWASPIMAALKQLGHDVLSTTKTASTHSMFLDLQDGYILITAPLNKAKTLSLDIYWSSDTRSLTAIRTAIVQALGASILSVYRLVSDGNVTPAVRSSISASDTKRSNLPLTASQEMDQLRMINLVLNETIFKFPGRSDNVILAVCESLELCLARDLTRDVDTAKTVYFLEMCGNGGTSELGVEEILQCERKSREWLKVTLTDKGLKARAIILDGMLSRASLQVFDAIVNDDPATAWRTWILHQNILVALPSSSGNLSIPHRMFSDRFHHTSIGVKFPSSFGHSHSSHAPALAEYTFRHSEVQSSFEVCVVVQGVANTVTTLPTLETMWNEMTLKAEETFPYRVEIRLMQGGPIRVDGKTIDEEFSETRYKSIRQPTFPDRIQASFYMLAPPSQTTTSVETVMKEATSVLQSMSLDPVKMLVTGGNTVLLEFKNGHLILRKNGSRYNFDLYNLCLGDFGIEDENCSPQSSQEFISRLLLTVKKTSTDWVIGGLDYLPRGPSPNMMFSPWTQSDLLTTHKGKVEEKQKDVDEDVEDDDDDEDDE